ncbi:Tetratricopeptide repeat protein [Maioricimonas rarisocia]|uniref:Tetratricopeptide repeat protein n=1 Tax=Maioricimonas rarisocia TaxID=2528026 RepID=A0A517ZEN3_9PLAN|nr:tetratricopeptide repeat protein [Maioricimonas rarisocia]QDU40963.1 Tetratricopeptide repeat protein [Maioricimonas rarisocia]
MTVAWNRRCFTAALTFLLIAGCQPGGETEPPETRFENAVSRLRSGDDRSGIAETARELKQTSGYRQHGRLLEAALQLKSNQPTRALRELQALRPEGELVAPARLFTAEALYQTGLLADAAECIRPLVDNPEYAVDAHRWLAAMSFDIGDNNAALAHLQEVIRLAPDDYRPRALAARMYQDFSQHEAAATHFKAALERSPPAAQRQELALGLARAQMAMRDYEAAAATLRDADPDATTLALRSECHERLGESEAAQRALKAALQLDAGNPDVLSRQADMLLASGEAEQAVAILERLVQADPYDHHARYRLSLAYRQAGRDEDASREAKRVEELKAKYDRLSELNNQAIQAPNDATIRRELAEICDDLGRPRLAEAWRRAAVVIEHSGVAEPD